MSDEPNFVSRTDTRPEFFNFISGLRADDLIAELIQNEIDAGSTHTTISFQKDRMLCTGNGHSVDENGWLRLSYLRGAGDEVPRKRGLIGVKNHGIKACFTIGDDIFIRSNGKYTRQTLYRDGQDAAPTPAAFENPMPDPSAPAQGCVVEVPYRSHRFQSTVGESVRLEVADADRIAALFDQAIHEIPDRFIGTVRPDLRQSYTIEVTHHQLGTVLFDFYARKGKREAGILWFLRTCKVQGSTATHPSGLRERVALRSVPRPTGISRDVSPFFAEKRRLLIEVAWPEDPKEKLLVGRGELRYPITYPYTGEASVSGFAAHYSAPFASDTERHGLAGQASEWNNALRYECDELLFDCLKQLVRRHGARAFDLLNPEHAPNERLCAAVLALRDRNAFPVRRAESFALTIKRKSQGSKASKKRRGTTRRGQTHRFIPKGATLVIPAFLNSNAAHSEELARAAPNDCWLLHPDVPLRMRSILTEDAHRGWMEDRITFDEIDALNRLRGIGHVENDFFPWSDETAWREGLADVQKVRACLDAVLLAGLRPDRELQTPDKNIHLPDENGIPVPIEKLFLAAHVPTGISDLAVPFLVHRNLADHPIFRKKAWKMPAFRLTEFTEELQKQELTCEAANELYKWTRVAFKEIPRGSWTAFRELPIWPNARGEFGSIERLCLPPSNPVRRIMTKFIEEPSADLMRLAKGLKARRLSLPIRDVPSPTELELWLLEKLKAFKLRRSLDAPEKRRFQAFEKELSTLAADKRILKLLKSVAFDIPALSLAGELKLASDLVRASPETNRLGLQDGDLIAGRPQMLERVSPTQEKPTADMIQTALLADPQNHVALFPRLRALADCYGEDDDLGVRGVPCVPLQGKFYSPSELCLKSNRGSYWGRVYSKEITGKNLSLTEQKLLVRAGVLSAEPRTETSREFFGWLAEHEEKVEGHVPEILRHFLHSKGVTTWWKSFSSVACIPAEGAVGYTLVSYRDATRPNSRVFLNDFPELALSIRRDYRKIKLAVDSHEAVSTPITDLLKDAGVHSLRRSCGAPTSVMPSNPRAADVWISDIVATLQSPKAARDLKKQLIKQEMPQRYLRSQWQSRVQDISDIKIADEISASFRIGRLISAKVRSIFDSKSGTLWLQHGDDSFNGQLEAALFRALAERIFTEDAPLFCAPTLRHAITVEIDQVRSRSHSQTLTETDQDSSIQVSTDDKPSEGPGAAPEAHHDWTPDPSKDIPSPGPLPTGASIDSKPSRNSHGKSSSRKRDVLEAEQSADLKENHYAWHCQIGLAERDPSKLAPRGSYAEAYQNRSKLIEAHHPDAVTANGARHAGNLLILSHYEHHRIGRHLSREQITDALKKADPRTVRFGRGRAAKKVEGVVAEVEVRSTGEIVRIFFTLEHREYWLKY